MNTCQKNPVAFQIIAKPTGPICNIDCTYCFYLEKESLYPDKNNYRMQGDVLESFIRQKIDAQEVPQVNFVWQGGEPTLLGVKFFKKVVDLQDKYANGKEITNGFQSNGILIDEKWCEFFKENKFLIGLSIDGPEELHNRYRLNKGGKPTFSNVIKGMELLKKYQVDFNTLTVVQNDNGDYPVDVYQFLKENGSRFMQFIPIVERIVKSESNEVSRLLHPKLANGVVTDWTVGAEQYGNFLIGIFKEWIKEDVGKVFVQIFDVALEAWYGMQPSLCIFRETCGQALAIEHNGDLYSCDHYVYPENKLGNILKQTLLNMVKSDQQIEFGINKRAKLPDYCINCEYRFVCNGECPKHRFIKTPTGKTGLNYLCAGYKKFFNYINPYMKYMVNELHQQKPPANVMDWAREKEKGFPSYKISANDPCPCGSGVKFKKCCKFA